MKFMSLAAAGFILVSQPAAAQGNGHAAPNTGTGVRNFGSWLDDASMQDPGRGFVTLGMGLFKTPVYREVDLPTIDSGVGITPRLQVGMSVPYYYANAPGEPVTRDFGDVYLNAKYQLRAPSRKQTGVAIIPMVEVLSVAPSPGGSRVQWALPVSVERQFKRWRAMGSGGYFSRGALFGAGAFELPVGKSTWATGSLSHSFSTQRDDLSTALGYHRSRTDLSGGLSHDIHRDVSVYGSIGRTIFARDANSASIMLSAGVSFGLKRVY